MIDQVSVILQAYWLRRLPGRSFWIWSAMLAFLVERLNRCDLIDRVILSTT